MVFGMNKGIFDGTYLKHPTRSGACQSSGATKTLDGKNKVGFIYTFSSLFSSLLTISIFYASLKSVHFKNPVTRPSYLSKALSFLLNLF